jgi:hypothetical protein
MQLSNQFSESLFSIPPLSMIVNSYFQIIWQTKNAKTGGKNGKGIESCRFF